MISMGHLLETWKTLPRKCIFYSSFEIRNLALFMSDSLGSGWWWICIGHSDLLNGMQHFLSFKMLWYFIFFKLLHLYFIQLQMIFWIIKQFLIFLYFSFFFTVKRSTLKEIYMIKLYKWSSIYSYIWKFSSDVMLSFTMQTIMVCMFIL